ncbi:hypothetical protein PVAP13_5KG595700 [Panicum virgatum]|uniref:Uncharacterized protein n=1 Tax=Panicum virgatum TaxID=38727 RepID=A0A8T0SWA9_PANVG|nr:hypothetical protein PVAP13_5KG595700 [Panicum virgatum]
MTNVQSHAFIACRGCQALAFEIYEGFMKLAHQTFDEWGGGGGGGVIISEYNKRKTLHQTVHNLSPTDWYVLFLVFFFKCGIEVFVVQSTARTMSIWSAQSPR